MTQPRAHTLAAGAWTHLVVAGEKGELLGLQELRLGDVQAVLPVQELHHAAVAVADRQVVLDHEALQVLDDAPVGGLAQSPPSSPPRAGREEVGGGKELLLYSQAGLQDRPPPRPRL